MIERPDAAALLAGPLGQWLSSQDGPRETARRIARERRKKALIYGAIAAVIAGIAMRDTAGLFWGALLVGAPMLAWAESAKGSVSEAVKAEMNRAVAKALGLDFSPQVTPGEEWRRACGFDMVSRHERAAFEDCWSGTLGALPFHAYEAHCEVQHNDGKRRRWVTVFRGVVVRVGFARDFRGTTLVEHDGRRTGLFGEKEEVQIGGLRMRRCDMVNQAFEQRFTVWGTDAVEAHYLVHPDYAERLLAVQQAFAGKSLRALFSGGELLVLLDAPDLFESGGVEARDDQRLLARTIEQFGALADMAARLNEAPRGV